MLLLLSLLKVARMVCPTTAGTIQRAGSVVPLREQATGLEADAPTYTVKMSEFSCVLKLVNTMEVLNPEGGVMVHIQFALLL